MSLDGGAELLARLKAMGETNAELRVLQVATVAEAKRNVHRMTGHLGRSIVPGHLSGDSFAVEARTPYAAAEELGRRAITIKPRNAKMLAWGGDRRLSGNLRRGAKATHFAKVVHQPAREGHPYLVPAVTQAAGKLLDVIVRAWNRGA